MRPDRGRGRPPRLRALRRREGEGRRDHGLRLTLAVGRAGARHMSRNYPFNCWYVAATSDEVGRDLLARRLLGIPVVLYRAGAGDVVAMEDRCIHRAYPLSAGRLDGDRLVCGYQGFVFDPQRTRVGVVSPEE